MELLGQRWMLRAIWELQAGALRFLDLRQRMDNCSSSVLSERLRQLSASGLVVKNQAGTWQLTAAGAEIGSALASVWDWAEEWDSGGCRPSTRASLPRTAVVPDEWHSTPLGGRTSTPTTTQMPRTNPDISNADRATS
ncbi:helix-turn-helix transcriptional regulator [Mycobacterium alsense]|nr:helix-turn-helix domain-containing protein [Mycobacterium alsense]MCV7379811.1 helix-turn-helix transcriptional regulator [Mycobacterium alsense]